MQVSIWFSLLFLIGILVLFGAVFFYQKTEETCIGIKWLALTIVAIMCFHTLVAGIINILHIPVNIITIGIMDLLAGVLLLVRSFKTKKWQRYEWRIWDIAFLVILLVGVGIFTLVRYGANLSINYFSVDPAIHFQSALRIVYHQQVFGMFHAALNNALLIELFAPAFLASRYYHIFVLADVLNLALGGVMIYGLLRDYCKDRFTRIVAIILPFLYLAGYQGNSTLFGFVYLGMGVTIIGYLIAVTDMFLKGKIKTWLGILLLALGCYGIFECYVMFMPVVFVAILVAIFVKQFGKKKLISKETVIWGLAIFLIPCILGLYYIFGGVFTGGTTVDSAIAIEGGMYRDLYSNFIPYIPLALLGWYRGIRQKENRLNMYLFPMWIIFIVVLLVLGMQGKVSSYYYFKTYYVMWLLLFVMCFYGIASVSAKERALVVLYGGLQLGLVANYFVSAEDYIWAKNQMFDPAPKNGACNGLLAFNTEVMKFPPYSAGKLDLYKYVYDELFEKQGEEKVICVSEPEDYFWYQSITWQDSGGADYYVVNLKEEFAKLPENVHYVCVLYESQAYVDNQEYLDTLNRVFSTGDGFVAEIAR